MLEEPERTGDSLAEVCRRRGISRETFYLYRRRYLEEGLAGLEPRSRRPRVSPMRIDPLLEAEICELRRRHPRWGARRIRAELRRAEAAPPAISTVHQALRRNHLVAPQPARRRRADKRFERDLPNDLWQMDATEVVLADATTAWVVDCLDDHARFLISALACELPTAETAWACFTAAAAEQGLPRQLLSDNGSIFTGRLLGVEVAFERGLAEVGVELLTARPYHPQTLVKLERFHRTLKEWLEDEGPAPNVGELQALLDRFRAHYNQERPHQGIGDHTPAERYQRLGRRRSGEVTIRPKPVRQLTGTRCQRCTRHEHTGGVVATIGWWLRLPDPMLSRPGPLPVGSGWSFELKWDGFRSLVSTAAEFQVRSRRGWDIRRSAGASGAPRWPRARRRARRPEGE